MIDQQTLAPDMHDHIHKTDTSEKIKEARHMLPRKDTEFQARTLYIEQVSVDHLQRSSRRVGAWRSVLARLHIIYLRQESLERRPDVGRIIRGRFHVHHSIFR